MASRSSPWEQAVTLQVHGEPPQIPLVCGQLFCIPNTNRLYMFGGFPEGSKDYLEELRELVVDVSGRPVSGWRVLKTRHHFSNDKAKVPTPRISFAGCLHQVWCPCAGFGCVTFRRTNCTYTAGNPRRFLGIFIVSTLRSASGPKSTWARSCSLTRWWLLAASFFFSAA